METTKAANTKSQVDQEVNINEGTAQVGVGIIVSMAAIIGLWGGSCMASAVVQYGVTGVISGWFGAISG